MAAAYANVINADTAVSTVKVLTCDVMVGWAQDGTGVRQGADDSRRPFLLRLAAIGERPKAQIARELGIRVNQLRQWRLDFEQEERPRRSRARSRGRFIWPINISWH